MLVNSADLKAALKAVKPHATTAKNPELKRVFVRVQDRVMHLYATDQYTLAESTIPVMSNFEVLEGFDTSLTMSAVTHLIADLPRDTEVAVSEGKVHTVATDNEARLDIIGGLANMLRRAETETGLDDSDTSPTVNPDYLARFKTSNLRRSQDPKETPIALRMGAKNRPLMVTYSNHFTALVMPVRKD